VIEISWLEQDLLLYRQLQGLCRIVTAYCPHLNNYIPNGLPPGVGLEALLRDGDLLCPFHGWRFNSEGLCIIPSGQRIPARVKAGKSILRRWAVRELDGYIQIGFEL
jgi:phenylpropionate dioxygenase-like ring-hydroxylating dioxygenase large terminal subunit